MRICILSGAIKLFYFAVPDRGTLVADHLTIDSRREEMICRSLASNVCQLIMVQVIHWTEDRLLTWRPIILTVQIASQGVSSFIYIKPHSCRKNTVLNCHVL